MMTVTPPTTTSPTASNTKEQGSSDNDNFQSTTSTNIPISTSTNDDSHDDSGWNRSAYKNHEEFEQTTQKERPKDCIDYRNEDGPLLQYLYCTDNNNTNLLRGQTLYLGSELSNDNKYIFHIPGHAERVLMVNLETNHCTLVGPVLKGKFKWLRGIAIGDYIYGLPCSACTVLRIHVPTHTIDQLYIPYTEFYNEDDAASEQQCPWKYHGGSISPVDGCIYCIPQSALHVLQINPITNTCHFVGPPLPGKYKWYGGTIAEQDGAIYGIPHNSPSVLRILPKQVIVATSNDSDNCTSSSSYEVSIALHGNISLRNNNQQESPNTTPIASNSDNNTKTSETVEPLMMNGREHKWHGAAVAPGDGTIVCVPANADTVLCIYPPKDGTDEPELVQLGTYDTIQSPGRHRTDRKYKYLGAMGCDDNGKVYCFPCAAERVLEVNTVDRIVREIGPNLYDTNMERICQNKWQNGVYIAEHKMIVGIPLAAESVLCIDCSVRDNSEPIVTTWPLPYPYRLLGKCEGAMVAYTNPTCRTTTTDSSSSNDNATKIPVIYCVPNCLKAVLRIELPSKITTTTINALEKAKVLIATNDHNSNMHSPTEIHNSTSNNDENSNNADCYNEDNNVGDVNNSNQKTCSHNKNKAPRSEDLLMKQEQNGFNTTQTSTVTTNHAKNDRPDYSHRTDLVYKSGIPTLRSSAHRVKFNPKSRIHDPKPKDNNGNETNTLWLPPDLCKEDVFQINNKELYDQLRTSIIELLQRCDPTVVGCFRNDDNATGAVNDDTDPVRTTQSGNQNRRLEDFVVPAPSTWRVVNGGKCEAAQKYLSDEVASDQTFLNIFDRIVQEAAIPYIKQRLMLSLQNSSANDMSGTNNIDGNNMLTFYYQRPPTIRLQPGPAWAQVKPHNDAEYGHQNGEINFWLPLTDRDMTGVDLWCETQNGKNDYHPIKAYPGEIIAFHGSSCRHYVNTNATQYTRVSIDFRIGVQGYFDPYWQMKGTSDDHGRKEVRL